MEQWTGSKLEKEYNKAVDCHPAYLPSMKSVSRKMPGWMNHKLNQDFQETGAYYTEWSKPERKTAIQYTNAYMWNWERW